VLGIQLATGEQVTEGSTVSGRVPWADLQHSTIFQRNAYDAVLGD